MDVTGKVSNMEEKKQNVATLAKLDNPFDEHDSSKQTLSKPDVEMGASWWEFAGRRWNATVYENEKVRLSSVLDQLASLKISGHEIYVYYQQD